MKGFVNLLLADIKQFFRDRVALFFTFAFPLFFMLLFGFVFSNDSVSYRIGLADEDNSPISAGISQSLDAISALKITAGPLANELADFKAGKLDAVLELPHGLAASLAGGQTTELKVYYDPAQTTSSQIILSILSEVVGGINQQITKIPNPLQLTEESIQSRQLKYMDYLVPGILAMSILFLGLFGSLTMVSRREKMVLKRFGATPVSSSTVVVSQVIYRLLLALVQTFIIIAIAFLVFKVHMVGNWLMLTGFVVLGALTLISIGYFAVARARTVESAQPIIQLVQFPMLFLSGIFWPIDIMPAFMKPVVNAMPLTYLGDALRQIMVGATPLHPLYLDALVLGIWLVVCMLLSFQLFKWE
jgi:ABC-2 type transport system permease protein